MTRIAILGATSQIAKDLIVSFSMEKDKDLHLFARHPNEVANWLSSRGLSDRYPAKDFSLFAENDYNAVINFVGAGDPIRVAAMGNSILDITLQFDNLVLEYLKRHPDCRYLFLSSGAAYGSEFNEPANRNTPAVVAINNPEPHHWYGVAKLFAECRHRIHPELSIIDIRIFNYFSRTQNISARFLITDILRAIRDNTVLRTSPDNIVRDFLHPADFHALICALLAAPFSNTAVDCYTRAPIEKANLLAAMQENFGLKFEIGGPSANIDATGNKPNYYSLNTHAAGFGYCPALTSLEGILIESTALLQAGNR